MLDSERAGDLVMDLEQYDCVNVAGRTGPMVSCRFETDTTGMTAVNRPIEKHGFVPVTIHWEEKRLQLLPKELMFE